MAAHEKSPRSLAARGALQKLATGEASNASILTQNTPSRQEICLDCNGLRSIGHGRGRSVFAPCRERRFAPIARLALSGLMALGVHMRAENIQTLNDCTRCTDGCAYFREVTTKKGGISRICQFHGHKVASGDLACAHFPGQLWAYGGGND